MGTLDGGLAHGVRCEVLLRQEEMTYSDLEMEVQEEVAAWSRTAPDLPEQVTERLLLASVRVGLRPRSPPNHGHRCAWRPGFVDDGLAAQRMLVVIHIKPRRADTRAERLDPQNGVAACPRCPVAFDTGLLAIHHELRVHVRPDVKAAAQTDPAARSSFGRPPLARRLLLP